MLFFFLSFFAPLCRVGVLVAPKILVRLICILLGTYSAPQPARDEARSARSVNGKDLQVRFLSFFYPSLNPFTPPRSCRASP